MNMRSRKLILAFIMFSLIGITPIYASVQPTIQWEKSVDVSRRTLLFGFSSTTDGGTIIAGGRYGGDIKNGILIKVDNDGLKIWEKVFVTDESDYLNDVKQTSDGGYVAIGAQHTGDDLYDTWVVKTDSTGNIEWQKTIGSTGNDYGYSILEDSNGDIVWTGIRYHGDRHKVAYGKISESGESLQNWFSLTPSIGYKIIETSDGGYVIAGTAQPSDVVNGAQMMITKVNSSMDKEWVSYYGFSFDQYLLDVIETQNGDFLGIGYYELSDGDLLAFLYQVNSAGETVQVSSLDSYDNWYGSKILQLDDGGFVISGRVIGEDFSSFMAGIDSDLSLEWIHEIENSNFEGSEMLLTSNGGILLGGTVYGDIDVPGLIKTGIVGDALGSITFNVEDEDGAPIIGASISVMMKTDVGIYGSTGQLGGLLCDSVTPGTYTVQVAKTDYETKSVQVQCISGDSSVVNVSLDSITSQEPEQDEETAVLTIIIQDEAESLIRNVEVVSIASPDRQEAVEGNTNLSGEVQFELLHGDYEFKLSKESYDPKDFKISITENEQVIITLSDSENETSEEGSGDSTTEPDLSETDDDSDFSDVQVIQGSSGNKLWIYLGIAIVIILAIIVYVLKTKGVI